MTDKEKAKNWKTFEDWKFVMTEAIPEFLSKLPEDIADSMDFSPDSLDILEEYILKNFTVESIKEEKNMYWCDWFARYIGETYRKNLDGAEWGIDLEDENQMYYGLPVITNAYKQQVDYCPHEEILTVLILKTGNCLSRILKNLLIKQSQ
jgi:hypothetical protein